MNNNQKVLSRFGIESKPTTQKKEITIEEILKKYNASEKWLNNHLRTKSYGKKVETTPIRVKNKSVEKLKLLKTELNKKGIKISLPLIISQIIEERLKSKL